MHDLRLALRTLRATPGVSAVAILSLALGIGANTAVFSLVDSLLLLKLPIIEPERLVMLSTGPGDEHRAVQQLDSRSGPRDTRPPLTAFVRGRFRGGARWASAERRGPWTDNSSAAITSRCSACGRLSGDRSCRIDDVPGGGPDGVVAVD